MAETTKDLPTYACHKSVKAFKIASIGANRGGVVLRSSVKDGVAIEINVSKHYIQNNHPRVGGYYVKYPEGGDTFISASHFEAGYALGGETPTSSNVLEIAKYGYDLWRKANPTAKILKKSPPTAYVLFREKKYEKHADKWIDAAQKL